MALVPLRGRQPVKAQPLEDAPHPRRADRYIVVALQVHRDLRRAEVIVLAQPQDLLDHLGAGGLRRVVRLAGPVPQPGKALGLIAAQPLVEAVAADAVVPAGGRNVAADLLGVPQHRQPVPGLALQLSFSYAGLLSGDPTVTSLGQF
jgi:hypothetical protein